MRDLRGHTPECLHPAYLPDEPRGYLAWHAWAKEKMKTHHQVRCPHCGLFAIWLPGPCYGALQERGAPATTDRRELLLAWLREPTHDGLTAPQIVSRAEVSRIYDGMNGRQERCTSDLRALEKVGLAWTDARIGGRWWATDFAQSGGEGSA